VLGWDDAARRAAFTTSAMKRVTLSMMKRNAVIALTNLVLGEPGAAWAAAARARIHELAGDASEDPMVVETARVSESRLGGGDGVAGGGGSTTPRP
jgi:epoxyqueuosine reductase QueG